MSDTNRTNNEESYTIGYKKPPKDTRFKPGRSGNSKGRPKGVRNFKTDVKRSLKERVRVRQGSKTRNVSSQEATLARLREKALAGDGRALDRFLALAQVYNDDEGTQSLALSASDREILAVYNARVLSGVAGAADEEARRRASEEAWRRSGIDDEPDSATEVEKKKEEDDSWLN